MNERQSLQLIWVDKRRNIGATQCFWFYYQTYDQG
ncbi:MAG: hypothetical protein FD167_293 [bacterium]|nr:MAG: hypothetical protein FD167_293 [bacterium]